MNMVKLILNQCLVSKLQIVLLAHFLLLSFPVLQCCCSNVKIKFDSPENGFFIKNIGKLKKSRVEETQDGSFKETMLMIKQGCDAASIEASLGPFSTKQTIPGQLLFTEADFIGLDSNSSYPMSVSQMTKSHPLEINYHLISEQVSQDDPVLRILYYLKHSVSSTYSTMHIHPSNNHLCIETVAQFGFHKAVAVCCPESREALCLTEITIPSQWWTYKLDKEPKKPKQPFPLIEILYSIVEVKGDKPEMYMKPYHLQPNNPVGSVKLVPWKADPLELSERDIVTLHIPGCKVNPKGKMYVPILLDHEESVKFDMITIRAKVKNGLHIADIQFLDHLLWNITAELSPKSTIATVKFIKKTDVYEVSENNVKTVGSILLVGDEVLDSVEESRIIWNIKYYSNVSLETEPVVTDEEQTSGERFISKLKVQKDDTLAVVPVVKTSELLNTAVLNGKQVSESLSIFIVSHAGKVADVTVMSSCTSSDVSVLKVSPSCTSVYLDGSEIRGSQNATIVINYDNRVSHAHFTVWVPKIPIQISISPSTLRQIKGWKVTDIEQSIARLPGDKMEGVGSNCRLKYQQVIVKVYAQFKASDQNSGREVFYLGKKLSLDITEMILPNLRVADDRIAFLRGTILEGRNVGRTEVQVISPVNRKILGAFEIRVAKEKVAISSVTVSVISGLQLSLAPDPVNRNVFTARSTLTYPLTARYQEALLEVKAHFSDGSETSLEEIFPSYYTLDVSSVDPKIVAFAPTASSLHPRVIAVGPGRGLLKVTLLTSVNCQKKNSLLFPPKFVPVVVDYEDSPEAPVQNDMKFKKELKFRVQPAIEVQYENLSENQGPQPDGTKSELVKLQEIALGDYPRPNNPYQEARVETRRSHYENQLMTPLEIGMYVLLTVFCVAILVFVVSCAVYASRYRQKQVPKPVTPKENKSVSNAHDWVWMGRNSFERNLLSNHPGDNSNDMNGNHQRHMAPFNIIANPKFDDTDNNNHSSSYPPGARVTPAMMYPISNGSCNHVALYVHPSDVKNEFRIVTNPVSDGACEGATGATDDEEKPPVPPHRNLPLVREVLSPGAINSQTYRVDRSLRNQTSKGYVLAPQRAVQVLPRAFSGDVRIQRPRKPARMQYPEWDLRNKYSSFNPATPDNCRTGDSAAPRCELPPGNIELSDLALQMNYEQLIEYFDNLKESNA